MSAAEQTHLIIDGRRWRASDPSIPPRLRQELVNELMAARRAVATGRRSCDEAAVAAARARVQDAKVALGERGPEWWEERTDDQHGERLGSTMRALLRGRAEGATTCPSEAARICAGSGVAWRSLMPLAREVAAAAHDRGELEVRQAGTRVADPRATRGPVRIGLPASDPDSDRVD